MTNTNTALLVVVIALGFAAYIGSSLALSKPPTLDDERYLLKCQTVAEHASPPGLLLRCVNVEAVCYIQPGGAMSCVKQ